ncbi:hypothetical protein RCL_jg11250.t1 [Rhizophagus clarus]|uniref:Uncharacterized protein n=1 Tax=Rhizophagus clarus TaxID=94130 RepID=A0A8H3LM22_9GLOM|nr:hypothetical protein RCL_jg11250.t1 [Rhizophagus clarus]
MFFFVKLFSYLFSQVQNTEVQNTKGPEAEKPRSESQIPEVESRTPNMRPWTSFQRSGTLFRGGPLSPELFRGGPVFRRSGTLFRGGPLSPELHRRTIKSGTPLEADYDISKVRNSISGRTIKSGTPLEADYDISKVRNSLEADYDISKVRNLEADRDFEGPELEADRRSERSGPSYFEADRYFEGPELQFEVDRVISKVRIHFRSVRNSLSQRAMIFEGPDSLSLRTIKVWIFQFEADQGISKMEPHFEVDQICGFQIRFTDFWKLPET